MKKSLKNRLFAALSFALVLVMAAGLCGCEKTFSDPKEHLEYAYDKTVSSSVEEYFEVYDKQMADAEKQFENGISADIKAKVNIGDKLLALVSEGLDLSFINNIVINMGGSVDKEGKFAVDMALGTAEETAVSLDMIMDMASEKVYMAVPELVADKYMSIDMDTDGAGIDMGEYMSNITSYDYMPDGKTIAAIIDRYAGIVIDSVKDATSEEGSITVGAIEKECTVIKSAYSEKDALDLAKPFLEQLKADEDIKTVVENYIDVIVSVTGETFSWNDDVVPGIDNALADLEAEYADASEEDELFVTFYIDKDNNLMGVVFEAEGDKFSLIAAEADGKNAFEFMVTEYGEEAAKIIANGEKNKDIYSGVIDIYAYGEEMMSAKIENLPTAADTTKFENAVITLSFADAIAAEMGLEALGMENVPTIVITMSGEQNKSIDMTLAILDGEAEFASVSMEADITDFEAITVPSADMITDEEGFTSSMDVYAIFGILEKLGIPQELLYAIG